jgi:hypothetical protein
MDKKQTFGLASLALLIGTAPAAAQSYYDTAAAARNGHGYVPATIVAGWEQPTTFSVLSIARDGDRVGAGSLSTDWKATLINGPKGARIDDDDDDDRNLAPNAAPKAPSKPKTQAAAGPVSPRTEVTYSSLTCPALAARMDALKPLAVFEFNPPSLSGNKDGPNGSEHEGFDLWINIGDAELDKQAATPNSALGRWYQETVKAISACPAGPKLGISATDPASRLRPAG